MLSRLADFVEQSNATNSSVDKMKVIKRFSHDPDVMELLRCTYTPYRQYHVTAANCRKRSDLIDSSSKYTNIIDLLTALSNRVITGHDSIRAVNRFVADNLLYKDLIFDILDRNLKTRSTTTMINKVVPGLIPTFDVALSDTYCEETKKKVNLAKDDWYLSHKLDGVRCVAYVSEDGEVTLFSRAGKEFQTLQQVAKAIRAAGLRNLVLDGEICMVDENGNEDFQGIIKEIKRKDHTIKNPRFLIFDLLTIKEFESKTSQRTFVKRQEYIRSLFQAKDFQGILIHLQQTLVKTEAELQEHVQHAAKMNWEGLMLRKNAPYKGKRSSDIMKVKSFVDAEYRVTGVEFSVNRVIVDGKEVEEEMLSNVVIEHRENSVSVGSGFSLEQRRFFIKNPEKILGKMICVQYFEETQNQAGSYSLRFPTFKAVYDDERDF